MPFGSRVDIWDGYDPLSIDRKGKPQAGLEEELGRISAEGQTIRDIAFALRGGWVVVYGRNGFVAKGIPEEAALRFATRDLQNLIRESLSQRSVYTLSQYDFLSGDFMLTPVGGLYRVESAASQSSTSE